MLAKAENHARRIALPCILHILALRLSGARLKVCRSPRGRLFGVKEILTGAVVWHVDIKAGLTSLPGLWAMEENGGGTAWLGLAAPWWKSARKINPERRRGGPFGLGGGEQLGGFRARARARNAAQNEDSMFEAGMWKHSASRLCDFRVSSPWIQTLCPLWCSPP